MPAEPGPVFRWARRHARRPAVRRVLEPALARAYALRNRRLSAEGLWQKGSSWEVAHWDEEWLAGARERGLLDPDAPLDDPLMLEAIARVEGEPVRILDVGAGPLTPLGKVHPSRRLELTATDALARDYDELLARAGVVPPVRTQPAQGERLLEVFPAGSFDIVHCGNALDHHFDPVRAVEQMLEVARPGGLVVLNHYVDEAESQHYLGMHQWNIAERGGALVIWNRGTSVDVTARLAGRATVETRLREPGGSDRPRLHVLIEKAAAA